MASPPIKRKHRIAIKTKTRKENNSRKRGRYSEMKIFIISMILFAVVADYITLRSPSSKTETAMLAVADKGKMENAEQSAAAAYHKPRKASEEDWAAVHAIT